ncbi:hypothetical protein IFM89_023396 [Coptis chinensis]|uniref:Uncharacterized protein n=1 Tax=Coptis chinensis TaxID=261450 RepID=A0A835MAK4_9MAGN|nr:hypothetical protein IFM89_023396 [Coptis chinensis]
MEVAKKAEDEDDLLVSSQTKTHGQSTVVEEKSVEKVVIETKKKAEDEDDLPVASLTKTYGLNAEVEEKSDEKKVIETKNAEHDDDFPISFLSKTQAPSAEAEEKSGETVVVGIKKNAEDAGVLVTSAKRKIEEVQHCETEREVEQLNGSSLPSLELGHETKDKQKKPKKKEWAKEGKSGGVGDGKANDISQESIRDEVNEKHITHKTQNGSEVKEKSDMKVVESCKKKDKDGIDLENEDKNDLRISSLSMAKGQSSEVEDKSDKNVVMESKKKAEAGDALPVKEVQDFETERSREVVQPTKCQTSEVGQETNEKRKKRKRKERTKLGKTGGVGDDKTVDITKEQPVKEELKEKPFTHKTEDGSVEVKENSVKEVVKARKKNAEDGVDHVTGVKKKTVDVKESETERIDENAKAANLVAGENTAERKKKKKRKIDKTLISDGNAKAKKESAMET